MGQQQLLLVILVTIIVGIATVVAINTFGTAADQANIDAVNNDIATLASAAQGFYMRSIMLGGGGRSFNAGPGINFDGLPFPSTAVGGENNRTAVNENGRYVIDDVNHVSFTIYAYPSSGNNYEPGIDGANGDLVITAAIGTSSFELGATGAPAESEE